MEEEVEILRSIYNDDIRSVNLTGDNPSLEIFISPTNTDNADENRQNLVLTLTIYFHPDYPDKIPKFELKNIRGIIEEDIKIIKEEIVRIAEQNIGSSMLFEIIQYIREFLRQCGNVPKECTCPICLSKFESADATIHLPDCYHYFHKQCLATHLRFVNEEIDNERAEAERHKLKWKERRPVCPVCRMTMSSEITDELRAFHATPPPTRNTTAHTPDMILISDKMRKMQIQMKKLFEKQRLAGGIIENKEPEIIVLNRPTAAAQNEVTEETTTASTPSTSSI